MFQIKQLNQTKRILKDEQKQVRGGFHHRRGSDGILRTVNGLGGVKITGEELWQGYADGKLDLGGENNTTFLHEGKRAGYIDSEGKAKGISAARILSS